MADLTVNIARDLQGGESAYLPVKTAAVPFQGSALSLDANGYARKLTSGEPFAGFCEEQITAASAAAADGARTVRVRRGIFRGRVLLTVTQANVVLRSPVYMTDDATFSLVKAGTKVGVVDGYASSTEAYVLFATQGWEGALADGPSTQLSASVAASAAVTNSTTATKFDKTHAIAANRLRVGSLIRVRAQAIATATNSTDTLNLKLFLGTVEIVATGAVDVADGDIGYIDALICIRTIGASGTLVATGVQGLGVPGTVTAKPFLKASAAVATNAALTVSVEATWSVANAGNSCRLDVLAVEVID